MKKIKITLLFFIAIACLFISKQYLNSKVCAIGNNNLKNAENYHESGFPSITGMETHKSKNIENNNSIVPSETSFLHDTGIKVYAAKTKTNVGSCDNIIISEDCPFIDFSEADSKVANNINDMLLNIKPFLTSYNFELYQEKELKFFASISWENEINNVEQWIVINRNGVISKRINIFHLNDFQTFKISELSAIPTNLISGEYSIKITYKYQSYLKTYNFIETEVNMATSLIIDKIEPIITVLSENGDKLTNGAYTNKNIEINVIDNNFSHYEIFNERLSLKKVIKDKSFKGMLQSGWNTITAYDLAENSSSTIRIFIDKIKPIGSIISNGKVISPGSYITNSFSYNPSDDDSGIKETFYKTPMSSDYQPYNPSSLISKIESNGWYYFYSMDYAGNKSEITSVYLETDKPIFEIIKNNIVVYTNYIESNQTIDTNLYFNKDDVYKVNYTSSSNIAKTNVEFNVDYLAKDFTLNIRTINITTATGINVKYLIHFVSENPYLKYNGEELLRDKINYFNYDIELESFLDENIIDPLDSGIIISSSGEKNEEVFLKFSEINKFRLDTSEGTTTKYNLELNDIANQKTKYVVVIDKEKPKGIFYTNKNDSILKKYTNCDFYFDYNKSEITCKYSINGEEFIKYNDEIISEDGQYTFILEDNALNKNIYKIIKDTILPIGKIYADYKVIENNSVTNQKIFFTWDKEGCNAFVNGINYNKNEMLENDGVYQFRLIDNAGNISEYIVEIDKTNPLENKNQLEQRKTILMSYYYDVIIDDKQYSFSDYEHALYFASLIEYNKYVKEFELNDINEFTQYHLIANGEEVKLGKYYKYKSINNSNIDLYYFNKEKLDIVVKYNAKKYISELKYLDHLKECNFGQTDEDMFYNYAHYCDQILPLVNGYKFNNNDSAQLFCRLKGEDEYKSIEYNVVFDELFDFSGIYEIKELDKAGNEIKYFVYYDKTEPSVKVKISTFKNIGEEILINKMTLETGNIFYYKSFEIIEMFDEDIYSLIKININGESKYYLKEEMVPSLFKEGKYEISIYDRLNNSISFVVYISGEEDDLEFIENDDKTQLKARLINKSENNTIIDIKVYRNNIQLKEYSNQSKEFTFNKEGLYKIQYIDNYERIVEKEYYFAKAKPIGILSVLNNSRTKSNVSFNFDKEKYFVEIYKNEILIKNKNMIFDEDGKYIIKLINNEDLENFNIYNFEIDNISPEIILEGVVNGGVSNGDVFVYFNDINIISKRIIYNNKEISENSNFLYFNEGKYEIKCEDDLGNKSYVCFHIDKTIDYELSVLNAIKVENLLVTKENFYIKNNEELNIIVNKNGEPFSYFFGDIIQLEGDYLFSISDNFGNQSKFEIRLDKSVDAIVSIGDGVISNEEVCIKGNEQIFIEVLNNGINKSYINNALFIDEGFYKIEIKDNIGNVKKISFYIVNKPKNKCNYKLGDNVKILSVYRNGEQIDNYSNEIKFKDDGLYYYEVLSEDKVYRFNLELKTKAPEIELIGINNGEVKNSKVVILLSNKDAILEVYKDGCKINYKIGDELYEYGDYEIVVKDELGNVNKYNFKLQYSLNVGGIILVVIVFLGLVVLGILIINKRKEIFKDKAKKKRRNK